MHPVPQARYFDRQRDVAVAVGLLVACFALYLALAYAFWRTGILQHDNRLFEADTRFTLEGLAHCRFRASTVHLALGLICLPIRALTAAAAFVYPALDQPAFREAVVLGISPLCGAISHAALYAAARMLGLTRPAALGLAAFAAFSFSALLFDSVPDHFALSGALISLSLALLAADLHHGRVSHLAHLTLIVVMGTVTLTNVGIGVIVYVAAGWRGAQRSAVLRRGVVASLMTASVAYLGAPGVNRVLGYPLPDAELQVLTRFVRNFSVPLPHRRLADWPAHLVRTFAPDSPSVAESGKVFPGKGDELQLTFQVARGRGHAILSGAGLALVALTVWGLHHLRKPSRFTVFAAATGAIVVYSFALHTFFGEEPMLYSLHWHAAAVLMAATLLHGAGWPARHEAVLLALLAVLIAAHNLSRMQEVFAAVPALIVHPEEHGRGAPVRKNA